MQGFTTFEAAELLATVPRISLGAAHTPLQAVPRLAAAVGVEELWIKREDNTGLALGGNKMRKLEYAIADALAVGADTLVTVGAPQSNHCRMTAAAAAHCGLDCHLVLAGDEVGEEEGNLKLDRMLAARLHFSGVTDLTELEARGKALADRLARDGRAPYYISVGVWNGLGVLGYVRVAIELADQFAAAEVDPPEHLFTAAGSCGTAVGLAFGLSMLEVDTQVVGISVSDDDPDKDAVAGRLVAEAAAILAIPAPEIEIRWLDAYVGEAYGVPTPASSRALELAARTAGVVLDPVYTAKALAGLIGEVEGGSVASTDSALFIHTGGIPALFITHPELYWGP